LLPLRQINNIGQPAKEQEKNLFKQTGKFMNLLKFLGLKNEWQTLGYLASRGKE